MTVPFPENLAWRGKAYCINSKPLEKYFEFNPPRPKFSECYSTNRAGYLADWSIDRDQLYLLSICGIAGEAEGAKILDGTCLTLGSIFPKNDGRVFASWFSGEIFIDDGEFIRSSCVGHFPIYERTRILEIADGVLTGERIRDNSDWIEKDILEANDLKLRYSLPKRQSGINRFWNPNCDDSSSIMAASSLLLFVKLLFMPVNLLVILIVKIFAVLFKAMNRVRNIGTNSSRAHENSGS